MGNSEVGHLNIGAGRVVYQDFTRIDQAIADGEFARNPVLADAVRHGRRPAATRCTCSASSRRAACTATSASSPRWSTSRARAGVPPCASTPSSTAATRRRAAPARRSRSWTRLRRLRARHAGARIASICGRYYAMDRDKRWERVAAAYDAARRRRAAQRSARSALAALDAAYARGETDEFVEADGDPRRARRPPGWTTATSSCS